MTKPGTANNGSTSSLWGRKRRRDVSPADSNSRQMIVLRTNKFATGAARMPLRELPFATSLDFSNCAGCTGQFFFLTISVGTSVAHHDASGCMRIASCFARLSARCFAWTYMCSVQGIPPCSYHHRNLVARSVGRACWCPGGRAVPCDASFARFFVSFFFILAIDTWVLIFLIRGSRETRFAPFRISKLRKSKTRSSQSVFARNGTIEESTGVTNIRISSTRIAGE